MTVHEDLRLVVELASQIEDRTPQEQKALQRVADRLDRERNRQGGHNNQHVDWDWGGRVACTFSDVHDKTCACRSNGLAIEPRDGWSRLGEAVRQQ